MLVCGTVALFSRYEDFLGKKLHPLTPPEGEDIRIRIFELTQRGFSYAASTILRPAFIAQAGIYFFRPPLAPAPSPRRFRLILLESSISLPHFGSG